MSTTVARPPLQTATDCAPARRREPMPATGAGSCGTEGGNGCVSKSRKSATRNDQLAETENHRLRQARGTNKTGASRQEGALPYLDGLPSFCRPVGAAWRGTASGRSKRWATKRDDPRGGLRRRLHPRASSGGCCARTRREHHRARLRRHRHAACRKTHVQWTYRPARAPGPWRSPCCSSWSLPEGHRLVSPSVDLRADTNLSAPAITIRGKCFKKLKRRK